MIAWVRRMLGDNGDRNQKTAPDTAELRELRRRQEQIKRDLRALDAEVRMHER